MEKPNMNYHRKCIVVKYKIVEPDMAHHRKLILIEYNKKLDKDTPSRTCCRPIAFDDDLSFLDDNVVYHTLKKHSARKCGCV